MRDPSGVLVMRGEVVESMHAVHAVVVDGRGSVVSHVGDPSLVTFLRSAAKPFQAAALVVSGAADAFGLTAEELAVAVGSHAGEVRHVAAVESLLAKGGVSADALQCGTHKFWNKALAATPKPTVLTNNCSGKHAGMLALQKHLGADPTKYLDPASPAQQRILALVAEVAGVDVSEVRVAVDGCGVPTFALPLDKAALMFARLAMPQGVSKSTADALTRVRDAMTHHADMVGGTDRFDTDLMGASEDRLVSKAGAEGFQGVGDLASGMGLALKVADGASRAVAPATVETLRQLSWLEPRAFEVLGTWWMPDVPNHAGRVVGRLKPAFTLTS